MVRTSDHIAATAMAPAPMKRTCVRQIVVTKSASGAWKGVIAVRTGTAPSQAMAMPSSMAAPTEIPTRWPAPNSAREKEKL